MTVSWSHFNLHFVFHLNQQFDIMEDHFDKSSRSAIGVNDAVLLDDPNSTDEFIENLRKRFRGDWIYVSTIFVCRSAHILPKSFSTQCTLFGKLSIKCQLA